jgi:hypothetical protein
MDGANFKVTGAIGGIGRAEWEDLKRRNQDYGTKYLVIQMLGLG